MRASRPLGVRWVFLACGLLTLTVPARAQGPQAPAVWYRASAECPTGPEFVGKIGPGQSPVRLAQAGDHIDFVVTLLAGSNETVGRLERQTDGGTVAIRELRDATCGKVADALALSLGLALAPPDATPATPDAAPAETTDAAPKPAQAAEPPLPAAPAAPAASAPAPPKPLAPLVASLRPISHRPSTFGIDVGALTGLGTQPMLRGSASVDIAHVARELSLRFALVGALGSSPTPFGSVDRWLVAARGEVSPWRWGGARVALTPYAAFELGVTTASIGTQSDNSVWAAPGIGLRASLALAPAFRLELGAGVLLPLVRGHVFYGAQSLYQDEIIAFHAAAGISFGER